MSNKFLSIAKMAAGSNRSTDGATTANWVFRNSMVARASLEFAETPASPALHPNRSSATLASNVGCPMSRSLENPAFAATPIGVSILEVKERQPFRRPKSSQSTSARSSALSSTPKTSIAAATPNSLPSIQPRCSTSRTLDSAGADSTLNSAFPRAKSVSPDTSQSFIAPNTTTSPLIANLRLSRSRKSSVASTFTNTAARLVIGTTSA